MGVLDYIIIASVILLIALAIIKIKKKGGCSGCSGCPSKDLCSVNNKNGCNKKK